jgi:hypothetical protein
MFARAKSEMILLTLLACRERPRRRVHSFVSGRTSMIAEAARSAEDRASEIGSLAGDGDGDFRLGRGVDAEVERARRRQHRRRSMITSTEDASSSATDGEGAARSTAQLIPRPASTASVSASPRQSALAAAPASASVTSAGSSATPPKILPSVHAVAGRVESSGTLSTVTAAVASPSPAPSPGMTGTVPSPTRVLPAAPQSVDSAKSKLSERRMLFSQVEGALRASPGLVTSDSASGPRTLPVPRMDNDQAVSDGLASKRTPRKALADVDFTDGAALWSIMCT